MDYLAKIRGIKEEELKNIKEAEKKGVPENRQGEISEFSEISPAVDSDIIFNPVCSSSEVYWDSDGNILGPASVRCVAKSETQFYLCVKYQETYRWIHESLLRSVQAFQRRSVSLQLLRGGAVLGVQTRGARVLEMPSACRSKPQIEGPKGITILSDAS